MIEGGMLSNLFFSDQRDGQGLLWLPQLKNSRFTQKLDWLSGLSVSRGYHLSLKPWAQELEKLVEKEELKLDRKPAFESSILIFKLPEGFKASMGLIIKNCTWESPDDVFSVYSKHSKELKPDFIQSPYIWPSQPSQLLKEVQWINL